MVKKKSDNKEEIDTAKTGNNGDMSAEEHILETGEVTASETEEVNGRVEIDAGEQAEESTNLAEQLELAREEAAKNLENWQRAAAELVNFKRRQEEQLKLQRDRIKGELLQGVISALDDMDLAFQNLPQELDGQLVGWVEGFRLVQRKLDRILDEQNVMPIQTDGKFDPNYHEAVSYEESDNHESDMIIAEIRRGYQIGNRMLRPALVRVAK
jgi:molecular chaperone GrpE